MGEERKSIRRKEKNEQEQIIEDLRTNFEYSKLCIFPSFFKFLIYLRKNKKEFAVILRTFGKEIPMIQKEFNYFV